FHDPELDLVYYNYRHYSPTLGRFLSRDPIQEQGGLNLYAFVKNFTIGAVDFAGKFGRYDIFPSAFCIRLGTSQYLCENYDPCPENVNLKDGQDGLSEYRTDIQSKPPSFNGCGSEFANLYQYIPDEYKFSELTVSFRESCNEHDKCYGTCGSDKSTCDENFLSSMHEACTEKLGDNIYYRYKCLLFAWSYYLVVSKLPIFADHIYDSAQDEFCVWKTCYRL
ncbi:MAG: hypothetical protein LUD39_06170, partial [Opitutae bacterium]|nr:hypothetical protein [Opitutae bacterium]